jgi:hypothetical protein
MDELSKYDPMLLKLVQELFLCNRNYIKKCKSSRSSEKSQNFNLNRNCTKEEEEVNSEVESEKSTTTTTTTVKTIITTQTPPPKTTTTTTTTQAPITAYKTKIQTLAREKNGHYTTKAKVYRPHYVTNDDQLQNVSSGPQQCVDLNENCQSWAINGQCKRNRQFMNIECKNSCDFCDHGTTQSSKKVETTTTQIDISSKQNSKKNIEIIISFNTISLFLF